MLVPESRFLAAYCERAGSPAFWAEPLNALTNAAFLAAAILALIWGWQARPRDRAVMALGLILAAIAIGSFAFHTVPNRLTVLLDVVPIQLFILGYLVLALQRFLGWPLRMALLAGVAFFVASAGFVETIGSRAMGGGAGYLPALAALFAVALAARRRAPDAARALAIAGAIFAVSLALRTLDRPFCSSWPAGLHFLWHLLNATVLGVLARAAAGSRGTPAT